MEERVSFPTAFVKGLKPQVFSSPDRTRVNIHMGGSFKIFSETDLVLMIAERKGQAVKRARVQRKARRIENVLLEKRTRSSLTDDHRSHLNNSSSQRVKMGDQSSVSLLPMKWNSSSTSSLPSSPPLQHVVCQERCTKMEPSTGPNVSSAELWEKTKCVRVDMYGLAAKEEQQLQGEDLNSLLCNEEREIPELKGDDILRVGEGQLMEWKAGDERREYV